MTLPLFAHDGHWRPVLKQDPRARALVDRHYPRQSPGDPQFMGPGRPFVLLTDDARAVWAVLFNLDPVGRLRWRCTVFRNEGPVLSSELVAEATERTFAYWRAHYRAPPPVPLTTEVDPAKVRRKRDPGRCFLRAGWTVLETSTRSHRAAEHVVLLAPGERERLGLENG